MPVAVAMDDGNNAQISTGINVTDLIIANKQAELEEGKPIKIEKMP